jgi:predicted transposase YdaD
MPRSPHARPLAPDPAPVSRRICTASSKVEPEVLKQTLCTVLPGNNHDEWLSPFQHMLREQRAEGLAEGRESGRAEGEALGEARGEARGAARGSRTAFATALLQLLVQRFGKVPDAARSRIESADAQRVQGWFAKALDARSIDEALAE